jgi:integrase
LYLQHVGRPRVVGGARPVSAKRYRAILEKFEAFALENGIGTWNMVTRQTMEIYAAHLVNEEYAYATQYMELTTLKQTVKWLVREGHLPPTSEIRLPLAKPQGTNTYCWRSQEVLAMIRFTREHAQLRWLGDVITALACTGLRISELASLRRTDIDLDRNVITLTDEGTQAKRRKGRTVRQTKSGRSRSFPIHADLLPVLASKPVTSDGLIFHGPLGGRLKPDTVRQILIREVLTPLKSRFPGPRDQAGFNDGRLHSFRHFFCSTCANGGVPEQVVKEWLGHRDSVMVRHYYHLHDEEAQRQMSRLRFLEESGGSVVADMVSKGEGVAEAAEKPS